MYIPKHFTAKELVDHNTYQKYSYRGDKWMLKVLFDDRILRVIDVIRDEFGPMTINDWSWGGSNQYRGWRSPGCNIGAELSQHKFGRAVDMIPKECEADKIREVLIHDYQAIKYMDIGGIEMGISWLHIDVRARDEYGKINIFHP